MDFLSNPKKYPERVSHGMFIRNNNILDHLINSKPIYMASEGRPNTSDEAELPGPE
ncbi:unnamed protein product [Dovyalis caffra]|uniref:Uncharacterized protein n=1 Tax=Dovyalis caffra TaxID=77055 RepID=A0AAV1S0K9_9ROSI|nr:unnamed protein product [Dovyalis caffra]